MADTTDLRALLNACERCRMLVEPMTDEAFGMGLATVEEGAAGRMTRGGAPLFFRPIMTDDAADSAQPSMLLTPPITN